jgi:hypothetical protein
MISTLLVLALAQASTAPVSNPVPPAESVVAQAPLTTAVAPAEAVPATPADSKKETLAERQERVGCVVKTGTRIKRKDRDNCANGRSISREDIERNGGVLIAPSNAPVPAGAGG